MSEPGFSSSPPPGLPFLPNVPEAEPPTLTGPDYATPGLALAAAPPPKRANWKRGLAIAGVIMFIAVSGIAVLIVIGWSGGIAALVVGAASAIIPVPFIVTCFLWLDRYEPEPLKYLAFCFAWGACVATGGALLVNTLAGLEFKRLHISDNLVAVIVAPIVEESMKALGPLLLFWIKRKTFSGVIDAIVYCGLSATGFAMVENILYLGVKGYASGVAEGGGALGGARNVVAFFIARIVLTGFAHPLFTAMTGIGLGIAVRATKRWLRVVAPIAGVLLAMTLHGSWNLMSVLSARNPYVILYGYFAVMMPIFLSVVVFALWLRSTEGRLVERVLPDYVRAGWLSPPEVAALATLGRRLSARLWAKRVAGEAGAKAMKAFQFDATRLALLRDRVRRGVGVATPAQYQETLIEERYLLDGLMAYRHVFIGRDPMTPRAVWDGLRYHVTFPDGVVRAVNAPVSPVTPVPVVLAPAVGYPAVGYPGYPPGYRA
jgi:RsiW-degrading membrane proteinase PrsW (M82 family)